MHLKSYLVEVHAHQGDPVPEFTLLIGARSPAEAIDLARTAVGVSPSWSTRVVAMRDDAPQKFGIRARFSSDDWKVPTQDNEPWSSE